MQNTSGMFSPAKALALFFFAVALPISGAQAGVPNAPALNRCRDLFLSAPRGSQDYDALAVSRSLVENATWSETSKITLSRARLSPTAVYDEATYVERFGRYGEYAHHLEISNIKELVPDRGSQVSDDATMFRQAQRSFRSKMLEDLKFVIASYRSRRKKWPESFLNKLIRLAEEYWQESTYIGVKVYSAEEPGHDPSQKSNREGAKTVATIRLIREKDGLIPMEMYLGFRLKTGNDTLKIEPGNYAMENEANEIATIETSIGMLAQMHAYEFEFGKKPFFATYADPLSERLYGAMGFRYVTPELIENFSSVADRAKSDPVSGALYFDKDGVRWAPMYADKDMLEKMFTERIERLSLKRGGEALAAKFRSMTKGFRDALVAQPTVYSGRVITASANAGGNGQTGSLKIERVEKNLNLFLNLDGRDPVLGFRVKIPYPLTENFDQTIRFDSGLEERVTYANGILTIRSPSVIEIYDPYPNKRKVSFFSTVEIWTDPMFLSPTRARYGKSHGAWGNESYEIGF